MPITLDATPGGANANSFATLDAANTYYLTRPLLDANGASIWVTTGDLPLARLIRATQVLCTHFQPRRTLIVPDRTSMISYPYYRVEPTWAGSVPATSIQALPFPRLGIYDILGRPIDPTIIPNEIKLAQIELAGLLALSDSTLQNEVAVQGITRLRADVVDLSFREDVPLTRVIPASVLEYIPPNWLTDERFEGARDLIFQAL